MRAACVLVAAGDSLRLGGVAALGARKPLVPLAGRPMIEHALVALTASGNVSEVVIVSHADDVQALERWCAERPAFARVVAVVPGGATRAESVRRGVFWCGYDIDVIAVHDAARPLVDPHLVQSCIQAAAKSGAALLAVPVADTIKRSDDGATVTSTLDRSSLWAAQTPQCFGAKAFRALCNRAAAEDFAPTDDAALWERYEGPVTVVSGSPHNLKVTTRDDLEIAERLLGARAERREEESA